jgi:single-stranded DNA-binding protein
MKVIHRALSPAYNTGGNMKNNHVSLVGMIPEDAELGETKDGTLRCTFKITVPQFSTEPGALEFTLFGLSAKAWHPHLKKDTPVSITGHLIQTMRTYDGKTFANLYLVIEDIQLKPQEISPYPQDYDFINFDDDDPTLEEAEKLGL